MNAYRGSRNIAPPILNLGTRFIPLLNSDYFSSVHHAEIFTSNQATGYRTRNTALQRQQRTSVVYSVNWAREVQLSN
jgi:hypothetical protein